MILKIKIENYKSIRSQEIELNRFNVLIGRNASGKTNFISAIILLKNLATGMDLETAVNKVAPLSQEFFYLKDHENKANFEFTIISKNKSLYRFCYNVGLGRVAGSWNFSIQNESLKKIVDGQEIYVYKRERDSTFEGPKQEPIPLRVEFNKLILNKYTNEDVAEVINTLTSYTIVDMPSLDTKEGFGLVLGNKINLSSIDGVAASLFIKNNNRLENAIKSIQKILPNFMAPLVSPLDEPPPEEPKTTIKQDEDIKRYLVTWREKNFPERLSYMSLSHGDRRVIHLFFSLFNTDENSFLIFEEIENGMHSGRLLKLLDEFRTQANNRKIQVLFTTHSTELLTEVKASEVIFCKKGDGNATEIVKLDSTDEYNSIKEDLAEGHTAADVLSTGMF